MSASTSRWNSDSVMFCMMTMQMQAPVERESKEERAFYMRSRLPESSPDVVVKSAVFPFGDC